jgi:hypothetical protein
MAVFLGPTIIEQAQKWGWDRASGDLLVRSWRGSLFDIQSLRNSLKSQNDPTLLSMTLDSDGESPVRTLEARFSQIQEGQTETDGTVPYSWELAGNMIEISIRSHPNFKSGESIPNPNPDLIQMTWLEVNTVMKAYENIDSDPDPDISGYTLKQKQLFNLLVSGVEFYQVSSWVLRLTRTFSSSFATSVPVDNVGNVYTYAQIQTEANTVISAPISNAVNASVPSGGEWLKQAPTISEISNRKVQWTQEWWYAVDWSSLLYDAKT